MMMKMRITWHCREKKSKYRRPLVTIFQHQPMMLLWMLCKSSGVWMELMQPLAHLATAMRLQSLENDCGHEYTRGTQRGYV